MSSIRDRNVEIFQDTIRLIEEDNSLEEALSYSKTNQRLYYDKDSISLAKKEKRFSNTKIIVSKNRSIEASKPYAKAGKRVCVLNFASATNAGGGVTKGSSAQEEAICRITTLYPCLNTRYFYNKFYIPHRKANNPIYNDDCIYTPNIVVLKNDIDFPVKMDKKDWYKVDIITCPAPNLRRIPSNEMNPNPGSKPANLSEDELYRLHIKRITKIFSVGVENNADVLILGAFGCGAFCNPPNIVAKAFYTVQEEFKGYFETIEYAIYCKDSQTKNYIEFNNVMKDVISYDLI